LFTAYAGVDLYASVSSDWRGYLPVLYSYDVELEGLYFGALDKVWKRMMELIEILL
jgi:hypothetical protein